ncbi:MAG TPA: cell division protein FtsA, partial [Alphaproteobacteria bacterium]|nr:cell division protein FtsA [Alphaproteobacteria bacterium]
MKESKTTQSSVRKRPRPPSHGALVAALDVGCSKTACFIARCTGPEDEFEIVGAGFNASAGLRGGNVTDLDAAEIAIRQAVHAAENMAAQALGGYPLRSVVVNVSGLQAHSHNLAVDVQVLGQAITDNDVRRALSCAQERAMGPDAELVHTIPAFYTIDGNRGIRDPRGMFGQTLEADIHIVTGRTDSLRNLSACIGRSHLDISALCVAAYAAGLSCLVDDEMDLGCTVLDIGGGVASFATFYGGALIHTGAVPLGGQHITSDIARGLTTSLADAERLKTLYGSAIAAASDESELIDVPPVGEDLRSQPNHIPRSLLVGIIQPRVEEILEHVRARFEESGLGPWMGRRIVMTGGTAQLPGLKELAQHVLDK